MSGDSTSVKITRRINCTISGTLANFFAEGAGAASWRPVDNRAIRVFGHNTEGDVANAVNSLRNAYILGCKVLEVKSTLPVPVGVSINCIPGNEITDTGEKYAFTSLPMSYNNTPHVLFEADLNNEHNNEWRAQYREYNADNLSTHNVLDVNGMPYVFVHESHPIIALLRANSDALGTKVDEASKIDGEWFKIGKQVVDTCCKTLQTKILKRLNVQDLNNFQVQLSRLDAKDWTEVGEILPEHMHDSSIFDKPCSFQARLELTYEIPH